MFEQEGNPRQDAENMRELARALLSRAEEEEQERSEVFAEREPNENTAPGIRRVVLNPKADPSALPGIRPVSLEFKSSGEVPTPAPKMPAPSPQTPSGPTEASGISPSPSARAGSEAITEKEAKSAQAGSSPPDAEEELSALPAVAEKAKKRPLRKSEIRQTVLRIQSGSLRPPFHVSRSPRRFAGLRDALDYSRDALPLPREMQLAQKPAHRTWLVAQINHCHDQQALSNFAFSLDYKDLATLFPALASLKRGEEIDRIISIIMMRASKYLYIHGWVTLQYAYPRSTVQKGLAELCEVLETQRRNEDKLHPERLKSDLPPLQLGSERFDWKSVRMISEISMPNTRHFLASMIRYIRDNDMSGDKFFDRYGIYRELPLGQAINSQWEMAMFEENFSRNSRSVSPVRKLFSAPIEIPGV